MKPLVRNTDNQWTELRPGDTAYVRFDPARDLHYVLASEHPARLPPNEAIVGLISVAGFFRVNSMDVIKIGDRTCETCETALALANAELRRLDAV